MINNTIPIPIKDRQKEVDFKLQEEWLGAQVGKKKKVLILVNGRSCPNILNTCCWPGTIRHFIRMILLIRPSMGKYFLHFSDEDTETHHGNRLLYTRAINWWHNQTCHQVDMTQKVMFFLPKNISQAVDFGTFVLWNNKRHNVWNK